MNASARLAALQARIDAAIPLAGALQVRLLSLQAGCLVVEAPLAPNINDKGTAFAGSLSALPTLAGWALVTLIAEQGPGGEDWPACEAAVFRSALEFLRPVRGAIRVSACLDEDADLGRARTLLAAGRRAKLPVRAVVGDAADPDLRYSGSYAVWRAGSQPF